MPECGTIIDFALECGGADEMRCMLEKGHTEEHSSWGRAPNDEPYVIMWEDEDHKMAGVAAPRRG